MKIENIGYDLFMKLPGMIMSSVVVIAILISLMVIAGLSRKTPIINIDQSIKFIGGIVVVVIFLVFYIAVIADSSRYDATITKGERIETKIVVIPENGNFIALDVVNRTFEKSDKASYYTFLSCLNPNVYRSTIKSGIILFGIVIESEPTEIAVVYCDEKR